MVVEFMALDGDTVAIATVLPSQARRYPAGIWPTLGLWRSRSESVGTHSLRQ